MLFLLLLTTVINRSYAVRYIIDNDGDLTDYIAIPIDVCYKNKMPETNYIKYTCAGADKVIKTQYSDKSCNTPTSLTQQQFTSSDQSPCGKTLTGVPQPKFDCTGEDSYFFVGVYAALPASCSITNSLFDTAIPYANGCYCDTADSSYFAGCAGSPTSASGMITKYPSSIDCSGGPTVVQDLSTCTRVAMTPTNIPISAQTEGCHTPAPVTYLTTVLQTTTFPTTSTPTTDLRTTSLTKTESPTTALPTISTQTAVLPTTTFPITTLPTTSATTTNIMTTMTQTENETAVDTSNIPTVSPFNILYYWIIKDSANCGDGYTDLNKSNNYYGVYCVPCPDNSAGTYGQCFECDVSEQPNHSRTECIAKDEQLFYASNEFNAIISVVSTLTGCGCLCGLTMFIKNKYFTKKDTEKQNETAIYKHVVIETV